MRSLVRQNTLLLLLLGLALPLAGFIGTVLLSSDSHAKSKDLATSKTMTARGDGCYVWAGEVSEPLALEFPVQEENAMLRTKKSDLYYTLETPAGAELHGDDAVHLREPYLYLVLSEKGQYRLLTNSYPNQTVQATYEVCEF